MSLQQGPNTSILNILVTFLCCFFAAVLLGDTNYFALIRKSSLFPYMCVCVLSCYVRLFVTPWTVACQAPLSMGFFRQEYWSGCHALLQGIFPTQGWNPILSHCRWFLYCLSHQRSPRILEWVAYPFSRGSSWPRNQAGVSCIAGRFFTSWATGKPIIIYVYISSVAQSCLTLCDPTDCSTPGFPCPSPTQLLSLF